jgi:hypothetical protein
MHVAVHLEEWIRKVDFTNIVQLKTLALMGPWPKDQELKTIGA